MDDIRAFAFGSLYENGEFCKPQRKFSEGPIEFLDSTMGAIGWNCISRIYYCRDIYCMGITWEELRSMGYVYGRPVRIDGVDYLCRCPQLGPGGEWERVVQATEGQVEWDTKEGYQFFGQEYIPGDGVFQEARPALLKKPISVYLGNACLRGVLLDYTDYDLSLEYDPTQSSSQPDIGPAVVQTDKKVYIDRSAITLLWK